MTTGGPRRGTVLVAHPGAELYGSDRVLLESVSALRDEGWRTVATVPTNGPLIAELEQRGAKVVRCATPVLRKSAMRPLGLLRLGATTVRAFFASWRLISREKPQVIYVNTITIPLWQLVGRLRGIPVLIHVHEGEASASRLLRLLLTLPLFLARVIVANSRFSAGVIGSGFARLSKRTLVIYNGVTGPPHGRPGRDRLDAPTRLTYIGRLSPRKGVDVAITALGILMARGIDTELDIVGGVFPGTEWYERQLHSQVRAARLEQKVRFHGFQPNIWDTVASGDIVVVPSRADEPFGDTAVEAILSMRPVIASATSGLLEATSGYATARTVQPDSPGALADAIQATIESWNTSTAAAWSDLDIARSRHAPEVYRAQICRVVARVAAHHR